VLGWSLAILILAVSVAWYFAWRWIDGIAVSLVNPTRTTLEYDFIGRTIPKDGPPLGSLGIFTSTLDEGGEQVWRVAGPPATTMGILYGDILVEWNGTTLDEIGEAYRRLLQEARTGDAVVLRVKRPEVDPEALLEKQGTLSPMYRNPSDLNLEYEDIEFANPGGMTLRGWYIPADGDRGVVFAHGNAGNRTFGLSVLRAFHEAGYHALQFDFSSRGDSDGGDFITYGIREADDLTAAVAKLSRRSGVPSSRVVLFGQSMGAATSLLAASQEDVGAVVSIAAYADAYDMVRSFFSGLPTDLFPRLMVSAVQRRAGFDLREIRPVDAVPQIRVPILYVHGQADRLTSPEHTERLAAETVVPHEMLLIPEMDHTQPSRFLGDPFMQRVLTFLDENGLAPVPTQVE